MKTDLWYNSVYISHIQVSQLYPFLCYFVILWNISMQLDSLCQQQHWTVLSAAVLECQICAMTTKGLFFFFFSYLLAVLHHSFCLANCSVHFIIMYFLKSHFLWESTIFKWRKMSEKNLDLVIKVEPMTSS